MTVIPGGIMTAYGLFGEAKASMAAEEDRDTIVTLKVRMDD